MNSVKHPTPAQTAWRVCHWCFWLCILPSALLIAKEQGADVLNFVAILMIGTIFFTPLVFVFVWGFQKSRSAWKKRASTMKPEDDSSNDKYFEQVAGELKSGELKQGVWAKALAKAEGDENRAKAFYIKMRVRQLVDAGVERATESNENYANP